MILRGFLYLICLALVIAFNVMNDGYIPFMADVAFISLSLLSFIILIVLRKKVRIDFCSYFETANRDSNTVINVVLNNDSFIPVPMCKFKAECIFSGGKKKVKRLNAYCDPHGEMIISFNIKPSSCEKIRIIIKKIYIADFFQLMMFSKKVNIAMEVLVLPKSPKQPVLNSIMQDIDAETEYVYSDTKAGDDPTEIFAIREYVPGDKIRNIHWKLSSKMNEVMVKDYGLPLFENDAVIVDIFPMSDDKNKKILNEVYDLLYGLIKTLLTLGNGIKVCFVNEIYKELKIDNDDDINVFFAELYECGFVHKESAAMHYYSNHNGNENRIFYVTDHMNDSTVNRMNLLLETGSVYYLIPKSTGGGEYPVKLD